jgi:hypothetical protein
MDSSPLRGGRVSSRIMSRDELARIDDTGVLHPVGKVASQRMRARKGAFRLMPAPDHVIFLRYVGEDGERDEEDGAVVRLAGEVTTPGALCDIVALVAQAGWKGELVVVDGDASRSLFFEAGNILGAQTNVATERLGALMYRLGALTAEQVGRVETALGGRRFGEVAIELGLVTREKVFEVMAKQTKEIAFSTLLSSDGMFYFLDRYDPARLALLHHVSANNLLMEGVQRMDEGKYFRQRIPSDSHIPTPVVGRHDPDAELLAVFRACDGHRSVLEIGRACGLSEFDVTRSLFQLVQTGYVVIGSPMPEGAEALVSIFNDAMVTIYQAAEQAGRAPTIRDHLAAFASSIGIYDALFAGAGPRDDGTLDEERIAHNIKTLGGDDPDGMLSQWLYEYVAFALFDAGSQLSKADEQLLSAAVSDRIAILAPKS